MRKLAMLSTALLGLALAVPSSAQPANSAPQPGLPPGASFGAPNAQQPSTAGDVSTTRTAPIASPSVDAGSPPPPPVRRRLRRRRVFHHRVHHAAPVAPAPAVSQ